MEKLIEIKDLKVSFHTYAGEVQAVRGVSFHVDKGETVAIVGESGCGKSVTAKAIMGLIQKPAGEVKSGSQIIYNDRNILDFSKKEWSDYRGEESSMIFQDALTSLNPTMNVGKQIAENLILHRKLSKSEAMKEAIKMLTLVGIPNAEQRAKQYPHEFSGGMRQRVMIAIALACNPHLLIADEPTTALDVTIQAQIMELIKNLQTKLGTSVVLITHDLGVVADVADRIIVMYSGKIVETGTCEEVFYNSKHPYTWALLKAVPRIDSKNKEELVAIKGTPPDLIAPPKGCPFSTRCKYAMKICLEEMPEETYFEKDHKAFCWLYHELAPNIDILKAEPITIKDNSKIIQLSINSEIVMEIKNLKKYFYLDKKTVLKAVDDISLTIRKGETIGIVGESGCGKTTFGRTCIGLHQKTSGQVLYMGQDVHTMNNEKRKEFTKDVQIIFQDPYTSLNPRMTVSDIIGEGIDSHHLIPNPKERIEKIYELLNLVGLNKEHASRFPHEFSGGQRQRIGIARALTLEPKFIMCDEPISALDVSIQAQVINLLIKLQREMGLTYMFIAHDLSMVRHISDRVAVMYLGTIAELTEPEKLYSKPLHPYTQALLSAIPIPDPRIERSRKRIMLEGDVPSPINPAPGCRFASRCRYVMPICREVTPLLNEVEPGHFVACHLY